MLERKIHCHDKKRFDMAKYFKIPYNGLVLFVYMWKHITVYISTVKYIIPERYSQAKILKGLGRKWNISTHEADHIWPHYRIMVFPQVTIKIASKTKWLNLNTF